MNKSVKGTVLPLITAVIWGCAFVFQNICADHLGPFTVNALRFLMGGIVLLPICFLIKKKKGNVGKRSTIIKSSFICGIALFAAGGCQQVALSLGASSMKAGFISSLYIVMVPIAVAVFKKKSSLQIWISVIFAVAGLYFMCLSGGFSIEAEDVLLLLSAFFYTVQIMAIDKFASGIDSMVLTCGEFLISGILSAAFMATMETDRLTSGNIYSCLGSLLYLGLISSCVGYSCQSIAQKEGNPVIVSLLMSSEALFATVFGAIVLSEWLTGREAVGCILMILAIILAEIPEKKKNTINQEARS